MAPLPDTFSSAQLAATVAGLLARGFTAEQAARWADLERSGQREAALSLAQQLWWTPEPAEPEALDKPVKPSGPAKPARREYQTDTRIQVAADLMVSKGWPQWLVDRWCELQRAGKGKTAARLVTRISRGGKVCGARTRRGGRCIAAPATTRNGRCKNHGGLSRGCTTPEGKARQANAAREWWQRWREEKAERERQKSVSQAG